MFLEFINAVKNRVRTYCFLISTQVKYSQSSKEKKYLL